MTPNWWDFVPVDSYAKLLRNKFFEYDIQFILLDVQM